MYFDRFDICHAWYVWLSENHGGQFSPEYARLSRLLTYFHPGDGNELSENAQEIYNNLNEGNE